MDAAVVMDLATDVLGSLALLALGVYMVLRGHLVPRRQHQEWVSDHRQITDQLRTLQDRNHYLTSLVAQVGSGHQRSTMKWSKEVGWRAEESVALSIRRPGCRHENAIPVESALDPEVILARLCPDCNEQLEPLPEGAQVIVAGDANIPVKGSLVQDFIDLGTRHGVGDRDAAIDCVPILFPAFEGDSGCRSPEPECCDCQEARYETPEETASRPILEHKCFKNP